MAILASDPFYVEGRLVLCYVYLLLCGEDKQVHIKVGMSQSPIERARALRNTSPLPIDVMATVDMPSRRLAMSLESDLHIALNAWRTNGEWFTFPVEDKAKFNAISRAILNEYSSPSRPLKWTKMNLEEISKQALQRRRFHRRKWKTGSLAYRDAVLAGLHL